MYEYRISEEEIMKWCSIPEEDLMKQAGRKADIVIRDTRAEIADLVGNMMADEMIANNKAGKITKWVLPSGPEDQYKIFISRVNAERISLKNLYVFHMDEILDWNCRPYPVGNYFRSCKGRMLARFYGKIDPELNVPDDHRIFPSIDHLDYPDEMCEKLGGIDTVWAGVGYKGLVATNESPESPYQRITVEEYAHGKTRFVKKNPDNIIAKSQRNFGGCYDLCDANMLTIGFGIICSAKRFVGMVTTGKWKQTVVRVTLFSEPTLEYPVTIIPKYVPEVLLCCDKVTADHPLSHGEIILSNENCRGEG